MAQKHPTSDPNQVPAPSSLSRRSDADRDALDSDPEPSAELVPTIACNVRRLRRERGLSLLALAESARLSELTLARVEDGQESPTIRLLWRVATALAVPFSTLVQQTSGRPRRGARATPGASAEPLVSRPLLRAAAGYGPRTELYEWTLAPASKQTLPANRAAPTRRRSTESLLVTRGRVVVGYSGREVELSAGDSIALPSDVARSYENRGQEPAVIYVKLSHAAPAH
jgi:transcriptional regulator with XRE-family HTH domain